MNSRFVGSECARGVRLAVTVAAVGCVSVLADAQEPQQPYVTIPDTVSPAAAEYLRSLPAPSARPPAPTTLDAAAWKQAWQVREDERLILAAEAARKYEPVVVKQILGGVPVLEVTPRTWREGDRRLLVYAHGGAYAYFSAASSFAAIIAADATGLRTISIDYTVAPAGRWPKVTGEVLAVVAALKQQGHALNQIAMFGDSAGGGLVASATLMMRDQEVGMPAALVLWSPWADVANRGDTAVTLRAAEPTYDYDVHLGPAAAAYADQADWRNPYVSPVYGDFAKGFPPTLVQGGTKEIFLSHFVRLDQAIDQAGGESDLDLYEGMTHVFQARLAEAPEGRAALKKMKTFLDARLGER